MPTPFMCHWCDKPTLEKSGICIKCEQSYEEGNKDIAGTVRELETRIRWYEDALKEIIYCCDLRDNYGMIEDLAKTALDGEPTTADEHNTMQEDEKLVYEDDMRQYEKDGLLEIVEFPEVNNIPENTVRISDVNKEIAEEWNREREEKIKKKANMIQSIGYRGEE